MTLPKSIFECAPSLCTASASSLRGRRTVVIVGHPQQHKISFKLNIPQRHIFPNVRHDEMSELLAKNSFHKTQLWRPVRYFWSVQDFVHGLRGALLGHQHLVEINILHRDVSENNVVLTCQPGQSRGAIIDFDVAIRYDGPKQTVKKGFAALMAEVDVEPASQGTSHASRDGAFKAQRTGTTPYMAINVLNGIEHTHYDDVESFLYVLLLFFFSYNGLLSTDDLKYAHEHGFTQVAGLGRAKNMTEWPDMFLPWSASMLPASHSKFSLLSATHSLSFVHQIASELRDRWGASYGSVVKLVGRCCELFQDRQPSNRVTHAEFIQVLDKWLDDYPAPPGG